MTFKPSYLALAVALSSQAIADSANTELDQVKVYGQKQVKSLQDTTASVGLVTSEDIESSTIQDMNDVFARIANISSVKGGNETIFSIRGVSLYGLSDDPVDYTASVYVDDVPLNIDSIRWGSMGLWDVEQIEAYRGPQGTLQGRSSLIGAIHLKTTDPTFETSGKVQASAGAFNTHRLSAAGGSSVAGSDFAIRVSADQYKSDGYIENETRGDDDYAGFERNNYRAKLLYKPKGFSNLDAMLSLSRFDNKIGDQPYASSEDSFDNKANSNIKTENDSVSDSASLKVNLGIGSNMTLTSISSVNDVEYDRMDDWDSSALDFGYIAQENEGKTVSQEFRLSFNSQLLSGVAGLYYSRKQEQRAWNLDGSIPKSLNREAIVTAGGAFGETLYAALPEFVSYEDIHDDSYETTNYAVFTDFDIHATEKLTVNFGARYDKESQDRDDTNNRTIDPVASTGDENVDLGIAAVLAKLEGDGTNSEDTNTDYEAFLPKVGVTYALNKNLTSGFTIQQGYRSGGSSTSLLTSETESFDPEFTINYELSLRSQFADGGITANANLFYTDWKDQQVDYSASGDSRDRIIKNAGESNLWGAEIELTAQLTSTVEVFTSAGYVETEFETFKVEDDVDYKGNEFPNAPKHTASAGTSYRGFNGVFVSFDANYQDEAYTDVENTEALKLDARIVVNTKVGYEANDWSAYVWATNLSDEDYLTSTRNATIAGEDTRVVGAPRMIGATFAAEF